MSKDEQIFLVLRESCLGRDALLAKNSPLDVLNCSAFLVDGWKTGIVFGLRSAKASISLPQRGLACGDGALRCGGFRPSFKLRSLDRATRNGGAMHTANSVFAIYETHEQAEQVVKALEEAGVDTTSLSIAARNTHEYIVRLLQRSRTNEVSQKDRSYLGWILASAIPICDVCQTRHRIDRSGSSSCFKTAQEVK